MVVMRYEDIGRLINKLEQRGNVGTGDIIGYFVSPFLKGLGYDVFDLDEVDVRHTEGVTYVNVLDNVKMVVSLSNEGFKDSDGSTVYLRVDLLGRLLTLYFNVMGEWEEVEKAVLGGDGPEAEEGYVGITKKIAKEMMVHSYDSVGERYFTGIVLDQKLVGGNWDNAFVKSSLLNELNSPTDLFVNLLSERLVKEYTTQEVEWVKDRIREGLQSAGVVDILKEVLGEAVSSGEREVVEDTETPESTIKEEEDTNKVPEPNIPPKKEVVEVKTEVEVPKVEVPVVQPKVEEPKVEVPKVEESVVQPKVEVPKVEAPVVQPKVEETKVAESVVQPKEEEPKVEESVVQPKVEEPKVAESVVQPKVEEPKVAESVVQPKVEEPKVEEKEEVEFPAGHPLSNTGTKDTVQKEKEVKVSELDLTLPVSVEEPEEDDGMQVEVYERELPRKVEKEVEDPVDIASYFQVGNEEDEEDEVFELPTFSTEEDDSEIENVTDLEKLITDTTETEDGNDFSNNFIGLYVEDEKKRIN